MALKTWLLWYRALNETTWTTVYNIQLASNDGTATAVTWAAGKINNWGIFNGSTSKIQWTLATNPQWAAARSVSCWFYRTWTSGRIYQFGNSASNQMFCMYLTGWSMWFSQYWTSSATIAISSWAWHHVVCN
jgi:hypothetical protein